MKLSTLHAPQKYSDVAPTFDYFNGILELLSGKAW